jgi:hypothetical protein
VVPRRLVSGRLVSFREFRLYSSEKGTEYELEFEDEYDSGTELQNSRGVSSSVERCSPEQFSEIHSDSPTRSNVIRPIQPSSS